MLTGQELIELMRGFNNVYPGRWETRTHQIVSGLMTEEEASAALDKFNKSTSLVGLGRVVTSKRTQEKVRNKRLCFEKNELDERVRSIKNVCNQTAFAKLSQELDLNCQSFIHSGLTEIELESLDRDQIGYILPYSHFETDSTVIGVSNLNKEMHLAMSLREHYLFIKQPLRPNLTGIFQDTGSLLRFHRETYVPLARKAFVEYVYSLKSANTINNDTELADNAAACASSSTEDECHFANIPPDVLKMILMESVEPYCLGMLKKELSLKLDQLLGINTAQVPGDDPGIRRDLISWAAERRQRANSDTFLPTTSDANDEEITTIETPSLVLDRDEDSMNSDAPASPVRSSPRAPRLV